VGHSLWLARTESLDIGLDHMQNKDRQAADCWRVEELDEGDGACDALNQEEDCQI